MKDRRQIPSAVNHKPDRNYINNWARLVDAEHDEMRYRALLGKGRRKSPHAGKWATAAQHCLMCVSDADVVYFIKKQ